MSKLRIKNILLLVIFFSGLSHSVLGDTSLKTNSYFSKLIFQLKTIAYKETITLKADFTTAEYAAPACTNDGELAGWYFNGSNYTGAMGSGKSGITPDLTGSCVVVSNMNRSSGTNSTTDGNSGKGICIGAFGVNSTWVDDYSGAVKFTVTFPSSKSGRLSKLDFYQQSPFTNHWYPEDIDICNNPAQKFGFRILKDGIEIYQSIDLATGTSWTAESFDLTGNIDFEYTNGAVFTFELAAYDKNDVNCWNSQINQEPVMWDLDDVKVFGCCVSEEICGNGIDDDGDGDIDNADSECNIVYRTTPSPCTVNIPASGSTNHVVTSTLSITESGIIEDLNVASLEILHNYIDDLNITLTSPAGTSVLIMNKPCGNHIDMLLTLDDESAISINSNCPPTDNARYQPDNPLSAFDGEEVNGDWVLTVEDTYPSLDGGSIECWSLEFDIEQATVEICDNGIDDDGDGAIDCADTDCGGTTNAISISVSNGNDDAEENIATGSVGLISSDLELISDGGTNQIVGMRFNDVNLPNGATITNAYIEFETDELDSGAASLTFSGDDTDNALAFSSTNKLSTRNKTTAVSWNNVPAWNTLDEKHQTPDLSIIIQEIVNRSGWTPNNSIAILVEGAGERTAESYNGEAAAAPLLVIEYCGNTPTNPTFSCATGILSNPDFESDATDWNLSANTSITTNAYFGTKAAYANGGSGGTSQNYDATAGEVFTLSAYAKKNATEDVSIGLKFYDASWTELNASYTYITTTTYKEYFVSIEAPANTAKVQVIGWKSDGTGEAWWDGFCLEKWTITPPNCTDTCPLTPSHQNYIFSVGFDEWDNFMDYDNVGLAMCDNGDGTLGIKGSIINGRDADWAANNVDPCGSKDGWSVDLTLSDRQTWTQFQKQYVVNASCPDAYLDLDYYDVSGTLTGIGCNTGRTLDVSGPSAGNAGGYRFQIGRGGNSHSCDFGMSTWFEATENGNPVFMDIYAHIDSTCYVAMRPPPSNPPGCDNLLTNVEFDNGTTDWWIWSPSGSTGNYSIDNGSQLSGTNALKIDNIATENGENWQVQVGQNGYSVENGKNYTVSFDAKSTANRNIRVLAQHGNPNWSEVWGQDVALSKYQ